MRILNNICALDSGTSTNNVHYIRQQYSPSALCALMGVPANKCVDATCRLMSVSLCQSHIIYTQIIK